MAAAEQPKRLSRTHFLREPTLIALQTMRAHKLRSFLMLLGVILSVSTLILVIALVSGMNIYFATRIANLGSNVFLIHKFPIITDTMELLKAQRRNRDITWDDYEALRDNLKLPKAVGVEVRRTANIRNERQSLEGVDLRGVTANIGDMDVEEVATGRYMTDSDNQHRDMVCMIGADVADKLFANTDPLGKILTVDGQEFQVVGVAKRIGNTFGQSQSTSRSRPGSQSTAATTRSA
jgi:putative ABC transport system permease protein